MNLSDEDMPCGIGYHPYFSGISQSQVSFYYEEKSDADSKGYAKTPQATSSTKQANALDAKYNYFSKCSSQIAIIQATNNCTINSSSIFKHVIMHRDVEADIFCVEPATHAVNAMHELPAAHNDLGVRYLGSGDSLCAAISFSFTPTSTGNK
jgi:galactose mutarotase-like enzyme